MTVRAHLVVLVLALLVPLLLFAGFAVTRLHQRERAGTLERLMATVDVVSLQVEQQITEKLHALQVLAESRHLQTGNLGAFYEEARRVRRGHGGRRSPVLPLPGA